MNRDKTRDSFLFLSAALLLIATLLCDVNWIKFALVGVEAYVCARIFDK
jgi:hypothetical protein